MNIENITLINLDDFTDEELLKLDYIAYRKNDDGSTTNIKIGEMPEILKDKSHLHYDLVTSVLLERAKRLENIASSGVYDYYGNLVKEGDKIQLCWIPPFGDMRDDFNEEKYEVVMRYGCLGIFDEVEFTPLFKHLRMFSGEYVSNHGNKRYRHPCGNFRIV